MNMSLFLFFYLLRHLFYFFFFFNDTATTEIYTLSLHDALPISTTWAACASWGPWASRSIPPPGTDRKSTRLNSIHLVISYAVFCLKKKTHNNKKTTTLQLAQRIGPALYRLVKSYRHILFIMPTR